MRVGMKEMFTRRDQRTGYAGAGRPLCRVMLTGLAAGVLALAMTGPAAADPPVGGGGGGGDDGGGSDCLSDATGSLGLDPSQPVVALGQKVTVSWSASAPCTIHTSVNGPGFGGVGRSGSMQVTPTTVGTNTWRLRVDITATGESLELAVKSIVVVPNPATDMVVDFQTPAGALSTLAPTGVTTTPGASLAAGTSPSVFPETQVGFDHVFTGSNGRLWRAIRSGGAVDTGLSVAAGTSPQMVLDRLGVEVVFQGGNGHLWTLTPAGAAIDSGLPMAPGTSPSAVKVLGGEAVAFQGANGHLWKLPPSGSVFDTGLAMAAGTSPGIAGHSDGPGESAVAFQGADGDLWTLTPSGGTDTGLAMRAGTGPSIVQRPDGANEIAFQANNAILLRLVPGVLLTGTGLVMPAASSPVITLGQLGAVNLALQGANGHLIIVTPSGAIDTTMTMRAGTSPSAFPLPIGNS